MGDVAILRIQRAARCAVRSAEYQAVGNSMVVGECVASPGYRGKQAGTGLWDVLSAGALCQRTPALSMNRLFHMPGTLWRSVHLRL